MRLLKMQVLILALLSSFFQPCIGQVADAEQEKGGKKKMAKFIERMNSTYEGAELNKKVAAHLMQESMHNIRMSEKQKSILNKVGDETHLYGGVAAFHQMLVEAKTKGISVLGPIDDTEHVKRREDQEKKRMSVSNGDQFTYYQADAWHDRMGPKPADHVGVVQYVRIPLPENPNCRKNDIETGIGWVRAKDHLAFSLKELRNYVFFRQFPNDDPGGVTPILPSFERAELITPARYRLLRFAPLAFYALYAKKEDKNPSYYIMEAGNGVGQSKVLYLGNQMDKDIIQRSGYKPTPFSDPFHIYKSRTFFDGNDVDSVYIKISTDLESEVYMELRMAFEKLPLSEIASAGNFIPPAHQILVAFIRIQVLKDLMGIPVLESTELEKEIVKTEMQLAKIHAKGRESSKLDAKLATLLKENGSN